jgi:3-deoxy-D-manno-octulosonic acid kinase
MTSNVQALGGGPEVRPVATSSVRGAMLYDASRAGNFAEGWFDVAWWQANGSIDGQARGRGSTLFVSTQGAAYALRHYRRGGLPGRIARDSYFFLGSERTRPMREWRLMHKLHRAGLPVPAPVAARVTRHGLIYRGDLITERIVGARSLGARIVESPLPLSDWVAVGRCIRRFHDAGVCHADLNAHNVLFDAAGHVQLIDFDRSSLRADGLWQDANLVRLRRSLLKITDPLPGANFSETDWHSLLAAYADGARESVARDGAARGAGGPAAR